MMKEPSLTTAHYTKLYKDISSTSLNNIHSYFTYFTTTYGTMSSIFDSMYRYYEICDSDEEVFVQCVYDVFVVHAPYYRELFDNYKKQYDYMTGNTRTMHREDTSNRAVNGTDGLQESSDRTDYDLPNKVVTPTTADGYATGKRKDEVISNRETSNASTSSYESDITHTYSNEILDLKKKYLAQIRNVFEEFCEKFSECFLHLFS